MDKLTLEDSFRELIKQRKWYVNSLRSPIQAKYDKATFQKGGKVPEEQIFWEKRKKHRSRSHIKNPVLEA